jgi:Domain of unknown function (DUF4915)
MRILDTCRCSLAISVYMSSRVILVSAENSRIFVDSFSFRRPMGIAPSVMDGALRLAIATFDEVVILADAPLLAASLPGKPGRYQHLLVPRATLFTGDIDAHDLAWVGNQLCAANTRFSCIAAIDGRCSFTPVWTPPFVSHLMPEDRCHLNGLAVAGDRIVYATAFARGRPAARVERAAFHRRRADGGSERQVGAGRSLHAALAARIRWPTPCARFRNRTRAAGRSRATDRRTACRFAGLHPRRRIALHQRTELIERGRLGSHHLLSRRRREGGLDPLVHTGVDDQVNAVGVAPVGDAVRIG